MTRLSWDQIGSRFYETGVDHAVLYLPSGGGVAWSGLTGVEESPDDENAPAYLDGVKYLDREVIGDFSGKLRAFTYPDEFEQFNGLGSVGTGLSVGNQRAKAFGLSYRTRIGNALEGADYGYRIHILYNVLAVAEASAYSSTAEQNDPLEFSWGLTTTPAMVSGYRPTAHVVIDSTQVTPRALQALEDLLYGTDENDPQLLSLTDLVAYAIEFGIITITDNGDGTWSASGPDALIEMLDETSFQISSANATYLDADTYEISTTII